MNTTCSRKSILSSQFVTFSKDTSLRQSRDSTECLGCFDSAQGLNWLDQASLMAALLNDDIPKCEAIVHGIYEKCRQLGESHPATQLFGFLASNSPDEIGRIIIETLYPSS